MRIALITGTSSGFGLITAIQLANRGYLVIATMRDLDRKDNLIQAAHKENVKDQIEYLSLDITKYDDILQVYNHIEKQYGKIDILINNAGYAQGGFFEEITSEQWQKQFQTNVFGHIDVTKTFLPLLRNNGGGKIINISSVSGIFGFPGLSPYTSSKFALEGWSESLRLELRHENIWVSLVQPASYQTKIWEKGIGNINLEMKRLDFQKKLFEQAIQSSQNAANPQDVADLIVKICEKKKPKLRYPIGGGTRLLTFVKALVPWKIIEDIVQKRIMK